MTKSFLEAMQWRYAVKTYDESKSITSEEIDQLKEILRLAPSGINGQPWKFYFVTDPELKKSLAAKSLYNERKINQAPLLIVFTAQQSIEEFGKEVKAELPEGPNSVYEKAMARFDEEEIKQWMCRQVYISLGVAISACAAMGIDATPMEGIQTEEYKRILDTGTYVPLVALCVGHRSPDDYDRPELKPKLRKPLERVVESR